MTGLMSQAELIQIWHLISSFCEFHPQYSQTVFNVDILNSLEKKIKNPFASRAM